MARHCYEKLPTFAASVRRVEKIEAASMSPLSIAMYKPAEIDLHGCQDFSLDFLSEWPERKHRFSNSKLYADYLSKRLPAKFEMARKAKADLKEKRFEIVAALLSSCTEEDMRTELNFAYSLLGSTTNEEKVVHLMTGGPEKWALLKTWFGDDGRIKFQPFTREAGTFHDLGAAEFLKTARLIVLSESMFKAVSHPIAKQILESMRSVRSHVDKPMLSDEALEFMEVVFVEVACAKLGMRALGGNDKFQVVPEMPSDFLRFLHKAIIALQKRAAHTTEGVLCLLCSAVKASGLSKDHVLQQPRLTDEFGAPSAVASQGGASTAQQLPKADEYKVGRLIKTISGIKKDELHDKKVESMEVKPSCCIVKFLERLLANSIKKRPLAQIQAYVEPPLVLPAGIERGELVAAEEEADAKKFKPAISEKALAIFGKAGVSTEND